MKHELNCSWVKRSGMCHGCGACSAVCPTNAIVMKNEGGHNFPDVGEGCIACGLCNNVCSGFRIETDKTRDPFCRLKACKDSVYMAHSTDHKTRESGSSGGFITQCLIDLLGAGLIDAAVVVFSDGVLSNTRAIIADSKDDIISSVGSKYYPVSVCSVLGDLDHTKRYAFVGKGCDVASLDLYCKAMKLPPDLFYVKIGIMCAHTPHAKETYKLMKKYGFDDLASTHIVYRGDGWPGMTTIFDAKQSVELDYKRSWCENLAVAGPSKRCSLCIERFASKADIVVGDAWVLNRKLENQDGGVSLLLAYSAKGRELIELSSHRRSMSVNKTPMKTCIASQPSLLSQFSRAYLTYLLRLQFQALRRINIRSFISGMVTFVGFICYFRLGPRKVVSAIRLLFNS